MKRRVFVAKDAEVQQLRAEYTALQEKLLSVECEDRFALVLQVAGGEQMVKGSAQVPKLKLTLKVLKTGRSAAASPLVKGLQLGLLFRC